MSSDHQVAIESITIEKAQILDAAVAWDIRARAISVGCRGVYPEEQLKIWVGGEMPEKFVQAIVDGGYVAKIVVKAAGKIAGKTVGTVMLNVQTEKVDGLFVYPEYMGRGVGRVLMEALDKVAKQENLKILTLESTLNAASFYRACGFVGDVVRAYPTKNKLLHIDCISMEKIIAAK